MENTYKRLDTLFYWKNLKEVINILESVQFIKEVNMMPQELLAAYNLWLSPSPRGLALAWILLMTFQNLRDKSLSLWW